MNRAAAEAALKAVGPIVGLGIFLPSIDKAWDVDPGDGGELARMRSGEKVYLGASLAIGLLTSYAFRSWAPFLVGFTLALAIVAMQEHALQARAS